MSQETVPEKYGVPWWQTGNLPALVPPPGVTPNFINPTSKVWQDTLTQSVCLSVASLLVLMRMYTKIRILRNPGWDDYTVVLAYLSLIGYSVVNILQDQHGNGRHLWDVTGWQFVAYAKLIWVAEIIYNPAIFFAKLSICLLYLRVFNPIFRTSIVLHVVLWANFTFYLMAIFIETFQCIPVQKAWYPLDNGHCINQQAAQISSGVINSVSDIIILLLPVSSIWSLRIHKKGKVGLFVIFSFGVVGCVASIARVVCFTREGNATEQIDATWVYYPLNLLSTAEITCAIVCSCLPAIPAFCRHVSGLKIQIIVSSSHERKPARLREADSSFGNSGSSYPQSRSPFSPSMRGQALETIGGRPLPPLPNNYKSPSIKMQPWSPARGMSDAVILKTPRPRHTELDDLEYVRGDEYRSPPESPATDELDLESGNKLAKMGFSGR